MRKSRRFRACLILLGFCSLIGIQAFQTHSGNTIRAASPTTKPDRIGADLMKFQFNGSPIHPGCVYELSTSLADSLPIVAAIDLEGCSRSNRYSAQKPTTRHGMIRFDDEQKFGQGYFEYEHIGMTSTGDHVVVTQLSGGGSGIFEDVLVLRFSRDRVRESDKTRDRVMMTCVGAFILGDRDDGKVELKSDRLIIGPSRYRPKEVVVPLGR